VGSERVGDQRIGAAAPVASGAPGMRDPTARPQQRLLGVALISAAVFVTALQDAFIKDMSADYPLYQMQVLRGGTALVLVFLWIVVSGGLRTLLTTRPSFLLLARSFVLSLASLTFYLALSAMQFPDAVAIYFSLPLMIAALSGLVIGESVPLRRWLAVGVAFIGVAIVMQPGSGVFEPASLIVLFSTLCYALGLMLTRPVGMKINSMVIGFWQLVGFVVTGLVLLAIFGSGAFYTDAHPSLAYLTAGWVAPTWAGLWGLLGVGFGAAAATVLYTAAYRVAAPSFVAPFEYSGLFWASTWSYLFWDVIPRSTTFAGAALIIGAGLWMIWNERRGG
jgi:drug/metabolite transporter (DMT)-like permease